MVLFLVGGAIAGTGIVEWRQLMSAVLARLSTAGSTPRPLAPVLFWFFARLAAAMGDQARFGNQAGMQSLH